LTGSIIAAGSSNGRQPVFVAFMAAKCRPCSIARDVLSAFAQRHPNEALVVVSCEGSVERVADFVARLPLSIRVVADVNFRNASRWRVFLTPYVIIVGADGLVRDRLARITTERLEAALADIMRPSAELAVDAAVATGHPIDRKRR
jgi:hypothetical protein